jgi:hypothetical protein
VCNKKYKIIFYFFSIIHFFHNSVPLPSLGPRWGFGGGHRPQGEFAILNFYKLMYYAIMDSSSYSMQFCAQIYKSYAYTFAETKDQCVYLGKACEVFTKFTRNHQIECAKILIANPQVFVKVSDHYNKLSDNLNN